MEKVMRARLLSLCVCVALVAVLCPAARGETLELLNVLEIQHEGVEDVSGLGGLTFQDSALWMGYAWSAYAYYGGDVPLEVETDTAWVGRVSPTDGTVLAEYPIPGSDWPYAPITGLAGNGPNLYATLRTESTYGIAEFVPGQSPKAVYDFQGGDAALLAGLTHDGSYLWQAGFAPAGRLYAIDLATNQRVSELEVDPYPTGVTWDGRHFYVAHHEYPEGVLSYIAKYDRAGNKLARYELPPSFVETAVGDLAVNGQDLYAHAMGTPQIAHLRLPAPLTAPSLPDGVTRQSSSAEATIYHSGTRAFDRWSAGSPEQLPVGAALRRVMGESGVAVFANAGSYFDEAGFHNNLHAMAYGAQHDWPVDAQGELTVSKTVVIAPGEGLPAGKEVWAKATLTLNGLLQVCRDDGGYDSVTPGTDATGLRAGFEVQIIRTAPGADESVFLGTISLDGADPAAGEWVSLSQKGDFEDAIADEDVYRALMIQENFASLALEVLAFDFRVPATVGEPFDVDVVFRGYALVPSGAEGLGAEVLFGEAPILAPGYYPPPDQQYLDGRLPSDLYPTIRAYVPEPSVGLLLAAGALGIRRRRRRS